MSEDKPKVDTDEPPKGGKKGLLVGLVLSTIFGGGAFYATFSGLVLGPKIETVDGKEPTTDALPIISFVPLEPMTITVGPGGTRQLKFRAELEVDPLRTEDVATLMPRILDILNGYLRAVDIEVLQEPVSLITLRAQMLHRVQLVTGEGHVRDLLITEFVFI